MEDIKPPPKNRLQFNIAITYFERRAIPKQVPRYEKNMFLGYEYLLEDEKECEQFYLKLNRMPASVEEVDTAFAQLKAMTKSYMETKGLMK